MNNHLQSGVSDDTEHSPKNSKKVCTFRNSSAHTNMDASVIKAFSITEHLKLPLLTGLLVAEISFYNNNK